MIKVHFVITDRVWLPVDLAKMNVGVKFEIQQQRNAVPLRLLEAFMRIKIRGRGFLLVKLCRQVVRQDGSHCGTVCNVVMRAKIMRCRVDKSNITSETDDQIRPVHATLRKESDPIPFNFNRHLNYVYENIISAISSPQTELNANTLISAINVYDRKLGIAETAGYFFISHLTSVVIELEALGLTKISRRLNGATSRVAACSKRNDQSITLQYWRQK